MTDTGPGLEREYSFTGDMGLSMPSAVEYWEPEVEIVIGVDVEVDGRAFVGVEVVSCVLHINGTFGRAREAKIELPTAPQALIDMITEDIGRTWDG